MNIKEQFFDSLKADGLCPESAAAMNKAGVLKDSACEIYLIRRDFDRMRRKGKKTVAELLILLGEKYHKSDSRIRKIVYQG